MPFKACDKRIESVKHESGGCFANEILCNPLTKLSKGA